MYQVIEMYGDYEPWWFLEDWEKDIVTSQSFDDLTAADQALLKGQWKKVAQLLKEDASPKGYQLEVKEEDILKTLSQLSGIPVEKLTQTAAKKYLELEAELHKRVIGQDQAVSSISRGRVLDRLPRNDRYGGHLQERSLFQIQSYQGRYPQPDLDEKQIDKKLVDLLAILSKNPSDPAG